MSKETLMISQEKHNVVRERERERERERQRQRDRQRETERERDRQTEAEADRHRKERETDRQTDTERDRQRELEEYIRVLFSIPGVGPDHYVRQQEVQEDSPSVSSLSDPVSCKYMVMEKFRIFPLKFLLFSNDIFLFCHYLHNVESFLCLWIVKILLVCGKVISRVTGLLHYNVRQFITLLHKLLC